MNSSVVKKKKHPLMFSLLFSFLLLLLCPSEPFLCFSSFFDEYLTLAPLVALSLGSLPLALWVLLGSPGHCDAARFFIFFCQPQHKHPASKAEGTSTRVQFGDGSC